MKARQLFMLSPESAEIREYDVPEVGEGQVKIVAEFAAAKHGTEHAFLKGYGNRGGYDDETQTFRGREGGQRPGSGPVGNMYVGRVSEVGRGVSAHKEGDRVSGHGPFREIAVSHADRLRKLPDGMDWRSAVCHDPADFAMAAVRDGNIRIGDAVAVFGMGAIGLMAVQACKLAGAEPVIAVEPLSNRREAATRCGADVVIDPTACDAGLEIKKATPAPGADVCIDYSGNVHAMQAAIRAVAFGGNVVAGAFPAPYPAGLDFGAEAHINRPNIVFSRACSEPNRDHPRWNESRILELCWQLLADGRLSGEAIVDPIVPFEELVQAYPAMVSDPGSSVKLGASYA